MRITFIRHAQSESNVAGRWQGQSDSPLSHQGRAQAEALGRRLAGAKLDRVVSSDLSRAAETAGALGRDVELDPAWRELDVGAWEGLTNAEVVEQFPGQVAQLQKGALDVEVGGGESWRQAWDRVDAALQRLKARAGPSEHIAVVTHGGVIFGLVSGLLGLRSSFPRPIGKTNNTAVTTFRFEEDHASLLAFNDATHLGPLGPWAEDRLNAGDTIVSVVGCREDDVDGALDTGRMRGAGANLQAIEHLAVWYDEVEHIYAARGARDAAAVFAQRRASASFFDQALEPSLEDALPGLAERHPGGRVALFADGNQVARLVQRVASTGEALARVAPPRGEAVTHFAIRGDRLTLADFGVGPHL